MGAGWGGGGGDSKYTIQEDFFSHQPTAGQINRPRATNILTGKVGGATERLTNSC